METKIFINMGISENSMMNIAPLIKKGNNSKESAKKKGP
jgi:hypothetical protein